MSDPSLDAKTEQPERRAPASETSSWTVLAHLLRPQGRRGEILAELLTDFPARFAERDQLYLAPAGFIGSPVEARPVNIQGHWLPVGRNQGRVVLHLAGTDTIEQAETLTHLEIIVPDEARVELLEDEEYIDDLLDCSVYDSGTLIGTVTAVEFPTTPDGSRRLSGAAPLLTVSSPAGDEVLIPYVQVFLQSLSTPDKRIDMRLPAGLLDLNRKA